MAGDSPNGSEFTVDDTYQAQIKVQTGKIEELNQEVHTLRNRLNASRQIEKELESEVECLVQQHKDTIASHDRAISKLKEDNAAIVNHLEQKVHTLEKDLQELQEEHKSLKAELKKASELTKDAQCEKSLSSLKTEMLELSEEHAAHRVACEQHQELIKILFQEKSDLLQELSTSKEYLEVTQEKIKLCKEDLVEQTETIEDLRNSLASAQNELMCLKACPSVAGSRGNSLFAEVEDKRQAMVNRYSSITKKYSAMKNDYSAKCQEISQLKLENLQLRRKWQEEEEEREKRDVWLGDNYEIRIKELLKLVEDLEKRENPVFLSGDSKVLHYAEQEVGKARKELAALREEMEWRSSERLNEAKALYTVRCELQTLKTQVMSLNAENIVLRDKLEEANISDIPSPGKTLKRLKEALQKGDQELLPLCLKTMPSSLLEANSANENNSQKETAVSTKLFTPEASETEMELDETDSSNGVRTSHTASFTNNISGSLGSLEAVRAVSPTSVVTAAKEDCGMGDGSSSTEISLKSFEVCPQLLETSSSLESQASTSSPHISEATNSHQNASSISSLAPTASFTLSNADDKGLLGNEFRGMHSCEVTESAKDNGKVNEGAASMADKSHPESVIKVELQENNSNESDFVENPDQIEFNYPLVTTPVPVLSAEKMVFSNKHFQVPNENDTEKLPSLSQEQKAKSVEPGRSILAKASRPHLMPLDQNLKSRKVSFADNEKFLNNILTNDSEQGSPEDQPKKKLVKMPPPKPFKTRFVVSTESETD